MPDLISRRIVLGGRVQGVGFRPFVWRLAHAAGLKGTVRNSCGQVEIVITGASDDVARFERDLFATHPPLAHPRLLNAEDCEVCEFTDFRILSSDGSGKPDIHLPADQFCCDDCLAELRDPAARRYRYPFTNCTQCGPRYTIIAALPYDRPNTSMADFPLCADCREEYENPTDRRFHAQPLACPECGPHLTFHRLPDPDRYRDDALAATISVLRQGGIVATKGVGGYHLLCDATNDAAVRRLRARKHRPDKPLAVLFPQTGVDGLDAVRISVSLTDIEASAIRDPSRPIVLARRRSDCALSSAVAPGLAEIGVFLPYSPLHHLLLADFGGPLVATSGNISGEPVITDNDEAERRLAGVADAFLHHNRSIVRPADDSVVRIVAGRPRPIRIGRGFAPLEIESVKEFPEPTLAVGGHMKGAIALGWGNRIVVSPHIGELDSPRSLAVFEQVITDLATLYRVDVRRIVADSHPGYASTRWAKAHGLPVIPVQHHMAHASVIAGEHPVIDRWLVFAWDGVGLGDHGESWGGEAFAGRPGHWRRVASLRPFHLLGGDLVGREPWRSAAALMWDTQGSYAPRSVDTGMAAAAWRNRINTVSSSSAGRLFDAAAALVLGIEVVSFEGQGPMMLEAAAGSAPTSAPLSLHKSADGLFLTDWEPLLSMLTDTSRSTSDRAACFHEALAQALLAQALALRSDFDAVGLCGGVFQNRLLAERVFELLAENGIPAHLPERVPANDGGLAFGQLVESLGLEAR